MTHWLLPWSLLAAAAGPASPDADPPAQVVSAADPGEADGADEAPAEPEGDTPVSLRVLLDGAPKAGGGKLVVQATYDPAGRVGLPDPSVDRLTFTPDGPPTQEQVGQRSVVTQRYVFRGPKGNYEIPPLTASWDEGERHVEAHSTSVFVDIDAPPPREGELADIVEPEPIHHWPWLVIGGVAALFVGAVALAFRPRRAAVVAEKPPPPPDVVALEAWDAVRDDPHLSIDEKAREVARIFRVYVEAALGFEATSRTTREVLDHLGGMQHLPGAAAATGGRPGGNVGRAERVLRAADRIKFAEHRPASDWLHELDADLRGFVADTKPSAWQREAR
ncbi:MAG: hypothetical protein R3F59_26520 [Myxococcota bacterium]